MINLTFYELKYLKRLLEERAEYDDGDPALLSKVTQELESRWNPLHQLPPLNIPVILKGEAGSEILVVREKLADSYSPKTLSLLVLPERTEVLLDTVCWKWRHR